MIVKDDEAVRRLDSPMNLINRLKSASSSKNGAMNLFGLNKNDKGEIKKSKVFNPFETSVKTETAAEVSSATVHVPVISPSSLPAIIQQAQPQPEKESTLDKLIESNDSQIKLGLAHDNALDLLNNAVEALASKLDDVKADKLPAVISAASKTVESIRKERSEAAKNSRGQDVHYHFYTPIQKKLDDFEVIEVG